MTNHASFVLISDNTNKYQLNIKEFKYKIDTKEVVDNSISNEDIKIHLQYEDQIFRLMNRFLRLNYYYLIDRVKLEEDNIVFASKNNITMIPYSLVKMQRVFFSKQLNQYRPVKKMDIVTTKDLNFEEYLRLLIEFRDIMLGKQLVLNNNKYFYLLKDMHNCWHKPSLYGDMEMTQSNGRVYSPK